MSWVIALGILGGLMVSVEDCTEITLKGKEPHRQVGMGWVIALAILGGVMVTDFPI